MREIINVLKKVQYFLTKMIFLEESEIKNITKYLFGITKKLVQI